MKVWEHSGRIEVVEIELQALGASLRVVSSEIVNCVAPDDMTRVCGADGFLIRVSQSMIRKWFGMGIFCVLRCLHCVPIFGSLGGRWVTKDRLGRD